MDAVRCPVRGAVFNNQILLKPTNKMDLGAVLKFFGTKTDREIRNNKEFFVQMLLTLPHQHRTYKQNNSVWALISAIFQTMEGRTPLEDEKKALYYDLLDLYADKIPNRFNSELRPIHISEANSLEGSRFIDGLLFHLTTQCELEYGTMATVQSVLEDWEAWKGTLEVDPSDYKDLECTVLLSENEWREKHTVSGASGKCGTLHLHHIVTKGSNKAAENKAWNWIMLTNEEHRIIHDRGDKYFLQVYPHLKGRFKRANNLAKELIK